ncbi:polymer-forming cytoskeletal protein [Brevundimonas sp. GCM10030266]|uniref:bactofilin family protein n=1 Tax=Brevundimonas sp. GCM10030266 TaxID=3273386 RepID=UPI003607CB99
MFNKTKSPAPQPQSRADSGSSIPPLPDLPAPGAPAAATTSPRPAAPAVAQRGLSTLSSDLQFEGNVSGAGDLQIDGQVKGDVRVGRLIVGETGAVEGNVAADYVEVRGRVVGAVSGKQVKLIATAYVDGDITAEQLSIDIGAYFQGRVLQGRREAPAPAAPAPAPRPVEAAPQVIDMKPPAA